MSYPDEDKYEDFKEYAEATLGCLIIATLAMMIIGGFYFIYTL